MVADYEHGVLLRDVQVKRLGDRMLFMGTCCLEDEDAALAYPVYIPVGEVRALSVYTSAEALKKASARWGERKANLGSGVSTLPPLPSK